MAISTLDGAIAGMQWPRYYAKAVTPTLVAGKPQSLWGLGGSPGAGAYDTTLNGPILSQTGGLIAGAIPFTDPGTGNSYLGRLQGAATIAGTLILCDRLWHNGGYTITLATAQTSTTPTWPSRDATGTTNGVGVLLGLEISSGAGAAAPTITISYTNSGGSNNRTGTNWFATANSPAAGSFFPISLQSGDVGVQSVQSLTLSTSWLSGTMNLVAYRPLAALELPLANCSNAIDCLTAGFVQMYNGSTPFFLFVPSTTTASNIQGTVLWTQG